MGVTAISTAYTGILGRAWRRFSRAAAHPREVQRRRLSALIEANASTRFGREHHFDRIDSPAAFQRRVPIRDYDAFEPWIDRVAQGEPGVLTSAPVKAMENSSGSTAANKLIPYTDLLLDEFSAATGPWIFDLYRSHPSLLTKRSYWSVSPVTRRKETTSGGIPIGFEDDSEYFGPLQRWALSHLMVVPGSVARISEIDAWRRETLIHLLAADDLGLISVWSPTFLTLLMEGLSRQLDELLEQLPPGRVRAIREATASGSLLTGEAIWPRLELISCWTDGSSKQFLPQLRRWFPRTPIQPKGLLATEGVVSFPLWGRPGAVLAVDGHFLEFIDVEDDPDNTDNPDRPAPLLADELKVGGSYSPLLTTGGGLYRYHLKDVLRCEGFYHGTPLVSFEGKLDAVSDLCGEKLNARHVEKALTLARQELGLEIAFAMLAPVPGTSTAPPHYCLFIETGAETGTLERARRLIEQSLSENSHYAYCCKLGQLGSLAMARVQDGWSIYQDAMAARGVRIGDLKPAHLDTREAAAEAFEHADAVRERIPSAVSMRRAKPSASWRDQ